MPHICHEGECGTAGSRFSSIRGLRQHQHKKHGDTVEGESALGKARASKRKRDAEDEEEHERQQLRIQLALEAENRSPEPESQRPAPLFERTVDTELQRSTRNRRLPARFRDYLPTSVVPTHLSRQYATREKQSKAPSRAKEVVTQPPPLSDPEPDDNLVGDQMGSENIVTNANSFGVFRKYFTISSHSPCDPDAFADVPTTTATSQPQSIGSGLTAVAPAGEHDPLTDSHNRSEDLLLAWMTLGSGNTPAGMNELVHNVIMHPEFDSSELHDFNAVTATRRFDREHFSKSGPTLKAGDGWKEGSVRIRVPCTREKQKEDDAPEFVVDGILYRDVVEVITAELEDPDAFDNIHTTPYEEWWYPHPGGDPVRIYSETYNSDAMLQADKEMRDNLRAIPGPGDDLETFIVSALLYSDSTHLASFGNASLWPMYLYLGNVSKYIRSKPTSFSAHHIAYIPMLPDSIKEFYREHYGVDPSADMLTHLGRELTHAVLRLILGGSFADAHKHSRRVKCGDNIWRRWLLLLLLHSADYKEKATLATIRSMGVYLCPRCLVTKSQVPDIGKDFDLQRRQPLRNYAKDAAARVEDSRRIIFDLGMSVGGELEILKKGSLLPTRNAYHTELGANPASLMVVDPLHDWELGAGRNVVMHNLRIFHAVGGGAINKFDARFRQVPTFGRDTIRKFGGNVSALKKLAGRDFEDIMQCWIPVLEGILPSECDKILLDLAFDMATWHSYAKLRMHTTHTVNSFRTQTKELGSQLRHYVNQLCSKYETKQLPGEAAASYRRKATKVKKAGSAPQQPNPSNMRSKSRKSSNFKPFNLETYKIHALGDYPDHIEQFGLTDCFTTQHGELEHRRVKKFYKRTNKVRFERQIAKRERMERRYRKYIDMLRKKSGSQKTSRPGSRSDTVEDASPQQHYSVANRDRDHVDLYTLSGQHVGDPALKDFVTKLKDHLLARILNKQYDAEPPTFTTKDRNTLFIRNNRLEQRYNATIYYTTYDLRRGKDKVNLKGRSHVMALSQDGVHPYAYAQVLGIYRVGVLHGPTMVSEVKMDVLWVRWFMIDETHRAGWKAKRLYRIKFVPSLEDGAFGFLDPEDVIRGSHLIPGFHHAHRFPSLSDPASIWDREKGSDWRTYYVNQFVDRDMFMRYRGGGVGHKYMREIEAKYENMSIERDHWDSRPKPPPANNTNGDTVGGNNNAPEDLEQPEDNDGGSRGPELLGGSRGADGDESDDENYVPSESGSLSDNYSTGSDEGSNCDEPSDFEGDPDDLGSDPGYESYGLADL